jgi:hypothetical protein
MSKSTNSIFPTISISSPTMIGACDSFVLDLSHSSGNCGRSWENISIHVTSDNMNVSKIQFFIDYYYELYPPTPIPQSLFSIGYTYSFMIFLCNFLNQCSSKNHQVVKYGESIPIVRILGENIRTVKTRNVLTLQSETTVNSCNGDNSDAELIYQWSVSQYDIPIKNVSSLSKDLSLLMLPKYSLLTNQYYTIILTVTKKISLLFSFSAVSIYVKQGNIVCLIRDGLIRNIKSGTSIFVDASSSYDEDLPGLFGEGAGLMLLWSCVKLSPLLSLDCSNTLDINVTSFVIYVNAIRTSEETSNQLTLTIKDGTYSR